MGLFDRLFIDWYWVGMPLMDASKERKRHLEGKVLPGIAVYETLPNAEITCLDYSPDMMERAKRQAQKREIKNVHFMQGDVGNLPFADESFDLVLSLNGFHAFPNKEAAYREIFRVLKPEVKTVEGMAAFRCRKEKADDQG